MEKEQKNTLIRILLSALLLGTAFALEKAGLAQGLPLLLLYLLSYFISGAEVLKEAAEGLLHGELLDEDFLMSAATLGALLLGQYAEADAVMIFFLVGELFEDLAEDRSRENIAALMDIRPDTANLLSGDGSLLEVAPEQVEVGSLIVVMPGDRIPLDGVVSAGAGTVNAAALTGESFPIEVGPGKQVLSGTVNGESLLRIRTTRRFEESTASRILKLVEESSEKKAKAENFVTRFARIYTPAVCGAALLLALIPSLLSGDWKVWIPRALSFLVASCPCALVISIPLSFFGAIGGASARGILIKGGSHLEQLASVDTVVFDKTGTLSEGVFAVTGAFPASGVGEDVLRCAAAVAETFSSHPIAVALRQDQPAADPALFSASMAVPGKGVAVKYKNTRILAGSASFLTEHGFTVTVPEGGGTAVHVAAETTYLGCLLISDRLRKTSADAVKELKDLGIRCVMLTGDSEAAAAPVAEALGIPDHRSSLLPEDKVKAVEELLAAPRKGTLAFAGDGVNDAPVIMRADVGIAMGALGSDAAIEAADVVLMDDDPARIGEAVRHARRCMRIVRENILFSIGVKLVTLLLSAFGAAGMWWAVFADVGVMILAVLNASRLLVHKEDRR